MTDAEALLWKLLRNRRIANAKFRRQHLLGRYILDFYCDEKKLVDCNSGFGRKRRPSGVQGKAHSAAIPGYREHVQRRHARRSGDRHFPIHCYSSLVQAFQCASQPRIAEREAFGLQTRRCYALPLQK